MRGILRLIAALFFLLSATVLGHGQAVLIGGKIAGQITGTFTNVLSASAVTEDRIELGPMVEFKVSRDLSLEADALHKRRLNFSRRFAGGDRYGIFHVTNDDTATRSWEIPVIMKWHRPKRPTYPFVGIGFSVRHIGGSSHIYGSETLPFGAGTVIPFDMHTAPTELVRPWTVGMIATAGVDIRRRLFHFEPELRYTRWPNADFVSSGRAESGLNRFQILIGIAVSK